MEKKHISSWRDLCGLFDEYDPRYSQKYIFRGVGKVYHELIPGVGREGNLRDGTRLSEPTYRNYNIDDEIKLFTRFKLAARPFVQPPPYDELEWMAIAQHHSLTTRLLDWCESPLVAAFFATEQARQKEDVAIYAAPKPPPITSGSPFEIDEVKLYRPPHLSPRITAQGGLFTVHHNPPTAWKPEGLNQFVIPFGICLQIKRRLMLAGISRASLFPDLDGLAQMLSWRYKWNWGLD